jgi:polysaccharide export outer membrane protein
MRWLIFLAVIAVAVFSVLNWRAQLQTQQRLDALSAALAERSAPILEPAFQFPPLAAPGKERNAAPREANGKLPPYVIEAPDMLLIEAVVKDPKTGTIDRLPNQAISGPFQVRPDGTVGLGFWGSVVVTGLTTDQANTAIRDCLLNARPAVVTAENLNVIVDVAAYNSKRYYVITEGDGFGEQILPFPLTGTETVLDAITGVEGLADVASKRKVWISRRAPNSGQPWQTLPIDWKAITQDGVVTTNYQLMPGDRLYVKRAE